MITSVLKCLNNLIIFVEKNAVYFPPKSRDDAFRTLSIQKYYFEKKLKLFRSSIFSYPIELKRLQAEINRFATIFFYAACLARELILGRS